jgi:hypothetical protein
MKWYEDDLWFEKSKIYLKIKEHFGDSEWRVKLKNGKEYKSKNWDKVQKERSNPNGHQPRFDYFNDYESGKRK